MSSVAGEVSLNVAVSVPATADFAEVFRAEFPRLAGYCAGLVGDRELGADLAQEALVRTWGRWSSVRDPHAYSYLVATNLVRKSWRDRSRSRAAMANLARDAVMPEGADGSIWDLVDRLPKRLRVPTLLHYYADLPAEQVAQIMHRPAGTIRQRLHESRARLARMLEED